MSGRIHDEFTRCFVGSRILLVGWPVIFVDAVTYTTGDHRVRWFVLLEDHGTPPGRNWKSGSFTIDRETAGRLASDARSFLTDEALNLARGEVSARQWEKYQATQNPLVLTDPGYDEREHWKDEVLRLRLRGLSETACEAMGEAAVSLALQRAFEKARFVRPLKVCDVIPEEE